MTHAKRRLAPRYAALSLALLLAANAAHGADWIVSGNDGKYQRVAGRDTYPNDAPDTLTVLDASQFPPRVVQQVPVETGIQGPPQAVAISPDGGLALVSAPTRYDAATRKPVFDTFLQVVDLQAQPVRITRLELGTHPQGVAFSPDGRLALVACVDGSVAVFGVDGKRVVLRERLKIARRRLSGLSVTHDGQHALVALRDEQGAAVLDIDGEHVRDSGARLSTGVAPYTVDVSSDGRWAVIGNAGLAGLAGYTGRLAGDADSVTLIDVSRLPFRTVQYLNVASLPEGIAISPDGNWIAAQSMDGSNLTADNPGRHARGKITLFALRDGHADRVAEAPAGEAGQGLVFSADSRYLLAQFNVEKQLAVYAVDSGRLRDTGERIALNAGPASLRSAPR